MKNMHGLDLFWLSFRKDSEQTKQIEDLQKQNEDLADEKERLLEEIERIISGSGIMWKSLILLQTKNK